MQGDPKSYQRLSIAQKRALDLTRRREPAVTCLACDMQIMVEDLLKHWDERCSGLRELSGAAKWVSRADALKLGVPSSTLYRWADNGQVRWQGDILDRKFSLRDLVLLIQARMHRQRRISRNRESENPKPEGTQ